jgi:hypothetical protein
MNWMTAWVYGTEFMSIVDKGPGSFLVIDVRAATLLLAREMAIH